MKNQDEELSEKEIMQLLNERKFPLSMYSFSVKMNTVLVPALLALAILLWITNIQQARIISGGLFFYSLILIMYIRIKYNSERNNLYLEMLKLVKDKK